MLCSWKQLHHWGHIEIPSTREYTSPSGSSNGYSDHRMRSLLQSLSYHHDTYRGRTTYHRAERTDNIHAKKQTYAFNQMCTHTFCKGPRLRKINPPTHRTHRTRVLKMQIRAQFCVICAYQGKLACSGEQACRAVPNPSQGLPRFGGEIRSRANKPKTLSLSLSRSRLRIVAKLHCPWLA